MNWPTARSSRASPPFSTANRAPDIRAAASKSSSPSASPRSAWSLAGPPSRGVPQRLTSTLALSSSPSGTSSAARFCCLASRSRSFAPTSRSVASAAAISPFRLSTSAFSRSASAMSFLAIAAPIAFDAAFRFDSPSCPAVCAARSSRSSFRISSTSPRASSTPRDDHPAT